jgi:WD40 repeat protein
MSRLTSIVSVLFFGIAVGSCASTVVKKLQCSYDEQAAAAAGDATADSHRSPVRSLFFTRDGSTLYSSGWDGQVRAWGVASSRSRAVLPARSGPVTIAFADNQQALAIAVDGEADLALFDLRRGVEATVVTGGATKGLRPFPGHQFSRGGALIAVPGAEHAVRLWNIKVDKIENELVGHQGAVNDLSFGPGDERIATASADGTVRVWDAATGDQIRELEPHAGTAVAAVDFSDDGAWLVTATAGGAAAIHDAKDGTPLVALDECDVGASELRALRFSPSGKAVFGVQALGCDEQYVCVWDAKSGSAAAAIEVPAGTAIDFSADGRLMATGGCGCEIILWDLEHGAPTAQLGGSCLIEVEASCD